MKNIEKNVATVFIMSAVVIFASCGSNKALTIEDFEMKRVERGCSKIKLEEDGFYTVRAEGTGKTADLSRRAAMYNARQQMMAKLPQTVYGQTDYSENVNTTTSGKTTITSSVMANATSYIQYVDTYNRVACEETYVNKNGAYLTVVVIRVPEEEIETLSVKDRENIVKED